MNRSSFEHIIGIDEVGRGPLAGPVILGAVCIPSGFNKRKFKDVKDSKLLTKHKREELYNLIQKEKENGNLSFFTSFVTASKIDDWGMNKSIQTAIDRVIRRFEIDPLKTLVLLDGLLKAPEEFIYQKTITKGDQKEKIIGAASIVAKVRRDRMLVRYSKEFKEYGFEKHKGYGTRYHREAIKKCGPCKYHRMSFLKNL